MRITGYWFLDTPEVWEPPAALLDFLESGPPPVFVGFGSMTGRHMGEVTRLVLAALARSGERGLLLSGWGGLGREDLPERVHVIDSAPFAWLFPRMAAVVHHGGAGTTGAGLRAGVPSVVVPFFGDQFFWGWRVEVLGGGPKPIPFKSLSVESLATAIRESVANQEMRRRAWDLGQRIRAVDGVTNAVRIIAEYGAGVPSP